MVAQAKSNEEIAGLSYKPYYAESDAESTHSDDTDWIEKLTLELTPLTQGDYMIDWTYEVKDDQVTKRCGTRIQIDDSVTISDSSNDPELTNDYSLFSGFKKVNLTAAAHTIDIDYMCSDAGGMIASIRNARLRATRIS